MKEIPVGKRIQLRREELGLSQTELAKRMGYSSKSAVSRAETSGDDVGLNRVQKFADALGVTPAYLMGWEDDEIEKEETDQEKKDGKGYFFFFFNDDDDNEDAQEFANVINSLNLSKEQRKEIIKYAKIIKAMEEEEKKSPN